MKKNIFIAGCSRGIGRSIAKKFYENDYNVIGCARTKQKPEFVNNYYICDVSSRNEIIGLTKDIISKNIKIDILVNNVGLAGENSLEHGSEDDLWYKIIDINLHSTYLFTKNLLNQLNDNGRIINIGSTLSLTGVPDQTAYCAAKHAVLGFTRSMSKYLLSRKITVNCVCPSWTDTDMASQRFKELGVTKNEILQSMPFNRIISPDEVADVVYFLSTDSAKNITGREIVLDGGQN